MSQQKPSPRFRAAFRKGAPRHCFDDPGGPPPPPGVRRLPRLGRAGAGQLRRAAREAVAPLREERRGGPARAGSVPAALRGALAAGVAAVGPLRRWPEVVGWVRRRDGFNTVPVPVPAQDAVAETNTLPLTLGVDSLRAPWGRTGTCSPAETQPHTHRFF